VHFVGFAIETELLVFSKNPILRINFKFTDAARKITCQKTSKRLRTEK